MEKKLTKHGNSLALVLDKPILRLLNIDASSELELVVEGNTLLIRAKINQKNNARAKEIKDQTKKIMAKHDLLFKKLAKS